jgi:hypothetical protein
MAHDDGSAAWRRRRNRTARVPLQNHRNDTKLRPARLRLTEPLLRNWSRRWEFLVCKDPNSLRPQLEHFAKEEPIAA